MKQSIRNFIGALTFAAMTFSGTAFGAEDPIYTSFFSNAAAGGYDVTSYFGEEGEEVTPVKGDKAFSTEYQGANWLFASQENLDKFVANPQAFAPQYGGYCAWAVAQGKTASGDPLLWTVVDGKLYLNYNENINEKWLADVENFIIAGDQNWPSVLE